MTETVLTTRKGLPLRILDALTRLAQGFCTVLLMVMTVIISWQIFGRFVLNDTPRWSEQLAGTMMVYLAIIGGAIAVREGRHIALIWFQEQLPVSVQAVLRVLIDCLLLMFGLLMALYGARMVELVEAWTIPTLGLSRSINYWPFPIAGLLIAAYSLEALVRTRSTES